MASNIKSRSESKDMHAVTDAIAELRALLDSKYMNRQQKDLIKKKALLLQSRAGELMTDLGVERTTSDDNRVSQILYRWAVEYGKEVYNKMK